MEEIEWPWQYQFPPFFTIQPNIDTRKKQLEAWCTLVLSYHKQQKTYSIDVNEAQNSPLFYNKKISRKLPIDGILTVLEELRKRGNVEWKDAKTKKQCLVMWRSPEEWGKLIYSWVNSKSMTNTVCTLFELTEGEESEGTDFHGLEKWLLVRALQSLQEQGKAELMSFDGNEVLLRQPVFKGGGRPEYPEKTTERNRLPSSLKLKFAGGGNQ